MNDCLKFENLISELIDNELDETEKIEVLEHIKTCKTCETMYNDFLAISLMMAETAPVPEHFSENVMEKVAEIDTTKKPNLKLEKPAKKSHFWRNFSLAACLAFVLVYGRGLELNFNLMDTATDETVMETTEDMEIRNMAMPVIELMTIEIYGETYEFTDISKIDSIYEIIEITYETEGLNIGENPDASIVLFYDDGYEWSTDVYFSGNFIVWYDKNGDNYYLCKGGLEDLEIFVGIN